MADDETLSVYDAKVADYVMMTERNGIDPDLVRFMNHLPTRARVLDLGCGPGTASAILRDNGFYPDPVDASAGMVRLANEKHALGARLGTFDGIDGEGIYDGVWANFSLLHAPREDLPGYLARLYTALKPDGLLHIGMKLGEGEQRDKIGRFYAYYSQDELSDLLGAADFKVFDFTLGEGGGLSGEVTPWITILARAA